MGKITSTYSTILTILTTCNTKLTTCIQQTCITGTCQEARPMPTTAPLWTRMMKKEYGHDDQLHGNPASRCSSLRAEKA
ncbi:Hypothetical protein SMAX5B_014524 [Scophthalmus maximus]|uniref:Uncharacterized protein n=1 Tax=Scophthalmus maximus TaxID=52904 RepID=A0A2U9C400_SCOMX|nr:Hypothetical protein SMAX5B_014524 [Scophthalmus maximus]